MPACITVLKTRLSDPFPVDLEHRSDPILEKRPNFFDSTLIFSAKTP
jgi:hypothetical protein